MQNPFQQDFKVKYKDEITLICFGDAHFGGLNCDTEALEALFKKVSGKKNTYLIGMGDMLDCITPQDYKRFRLSGIDPKYLTTDVESRDNLIFNQADDLIGLIKKYGIEKQILGLVSGNHPEMILKRYGTDVHRYFCNQLKVRNLGYSFALIMSFKYNKRSWRKIVFGHHGWGSSRTQGGNMTRFSKVAQDHPYADIYLFGHTHEQKAWSDSPFFPVQRDGEWVWESKKRLFAICSTFLKTYSNEITPSYSEMAGYSPVPISYVEIKLTMPAHGDDSCIGITSKV
jgi:hypothetical protein